MFTHVLLATLVLNTFAIPINYEDREFDANLQITFSVADGLLPAPVDGRIILMFAPNGTEPLNDTEVTSSPNKFFGRNVYNFGSNSTVTLSGGSDSNTAIDVYEWPNVSMSDVEPGSYSVQAFLTRYESVTREDGSEISIRFPCGGGGVNVNSFGSLITSAADIEISGGAQILDLIFNIITAAGPFTGKEIGECYQGNYEDTDFLKHKLPRIL